MFFRFFIVIFLALACCLFLAACQPPYGDLVPIPQEGLEILSVDFKDDTAQATRNQITVRASGGWDGSRETSVAITVDNQGAGAIILDLRQCELINNYNEKGEFQVAYERKGMGNPVASKYPPNESKTIRIDEHQVRELIIKFDYPYSSESRDFENQTAQFSLVLERHGGASVRTDFVFRFKYVESQAGHKRF